jgi:hypothetical protein
MLPLLSLQYTHNYVCSEWSFTNNIKYWKRMSKINIAVPIRKQTGRALIWVAIEKIVYIATSICVTSWKVCKNIQYTISLK